MRFRLRTLLIWFFKKPVGFFDKTNPKATRQSMLRWSIVGAVFGAVTFFIFDPHPSRGGSLIWLPLWIVLNAAVAGLVEWQID